MKVKKFMAATAAATMLSASIGGIAHAQPAPQDSAQTQPEQGATSGVTQGQEQGQEQAPNQESSAPVTETKTVEIIIKETTEIDVNGIQGIALADAGVFVFEPFSGEDEEEELTIGDLIKNPEKFLEKSDGNKGFEAKKDVDGSHITPDNVHLYMEWMTKEQQNRLNGVKSYQTLVETAGAELPTNPFNGTKPTDKATELANIDTMLNQAHSEYNDVVSKMGDRVVPENMKPLYTKFVKERKDQALKYIDMKMNEESSEFMKAAGQAQKDAVINGDSVKLSASQDTISSALDKAKESGQGISDLKFQGDDGVNGYLIIPKADDNKPQEPQPQGQSQSQPQQGNENLPNVDGQVVTTK